MKGVSTFCCVLLASSTQANEIMLERQRVGGQLFQPSIAQASFAVETIDSETLAQLPVNNIADALEWVLGLDVRQRGGYGTQADIGIRGAGYEQTLILLDGVRMNDAQTGHHNLDIAIALEDIERIEIVRGPGAGLYGPNGNAGVINLVTRKTLSHTDSHHQGMLKVETGSHDYQRALLKASQQWGNWTGHMSLSEQQADSYLSGFNLGHEQRMANVRLHHQQAHSQTSISAGVMSKEFGAQGFYAAAANDAFERTEQRQLYATHQRSLSATQHMDVTVNWRRHNDEFYYLNYAPSEHETNAYQARIRWHFSAISIGIEGNEERMTSTSTFDRSYQRRFHSAFVYGQFTTHMLQWSASLSTLNYEDDQPFWLPVLGVSWPLGAHQIYANLGRSVRMPTMTDLYQNQAANLGNPDLKPEKTDSVELGTRLNLYGVQARLAVFERQTRDAIDFTRTQAEQAANAAFKARNLNQVTSIGVDAELDASDVLANTAITHLSLGVSHVEQRRIREFADARYHQNPLTQQWVLSTTVAISPTLSWSTQYQYEVRAQQADIQLINSGITQHFKHWHWRLMARNLLDERYIDSGYSQALGRTVQAELALNF